MPTTESAKPSGPSKGQPFDPADPLGIDDLLGPEDLAIRDTVRTWAADRVLPHIAEWYENGELPGIRELARELGSLGALGMSLEGYGCAGASAVQYGLACLELEAADSGIRSLVSVQGSLAMYAIHRFGSEEQKERWLPGMAAGGTIGCFGLTEPDHGSDPAGMRTYARRDGEDWILTGRKMWITNGSVAGVAVVWAQTGEADGGRGIRGFVVPTDSPGFSAPEIRHKWSLRASVTSELVMDGVRLPADAVLPGATGLRGPLSCLSHARYGIVWGAMGAARASFEAALDYAKSREQFGRPIGGFQLTQAKLADMALELHKGILLAHHLGRRMDAGRIRPEQISFGKLNNVREAIGICRTARTVLGANGISLEYPVMRHATNLESVLTYEGTVEMHQLVLGKALTGLDAFR
ncbi:acyl-CoA dehydrogenase family protein [Streptomyces sp. NPDC056796]|uniref:acyl-CoA dehydrogenase family protein n=1 Tax=unclassified Streptomyces TaxID=2593676 RepID=UPI0036A1ED12